MEIEWEDPPEAAVLRAHQGGQYIEFAIALRDHPDKWALLPTQTPRTDKGAQSAAQNIRRGVTKAFAKGEYDAVADKGKVYVKFLKPEDRKVVADKPPPASDDDGPPPDEAELAEAARRRAAKAERDPALAPLVRQWARDNGYEVPERGRMADEVWAGYKEARGEPEAAQRKAE